MEILDLRFHDFNGTLVNFKTKEYVFPSIFEFITNSEKYKDFIVIDEHIADIVMRCNSHGIKTYYCCSGHPLDKYYDPGHISPKFSAYISFERKPIIKHMFDNSKYWNVEDGYIEMGQTPAYTICTKPGCHSFKQWYKAMNELRYRFSHLTNEFRQIYIN